MDYINEWYTFSSSIDKSICNRIKKLAHNKWKDASVQLIPKDGSQELTEEERKIGIKRNVGVDKTVRISEVVWIDNQWVYDIIWPYMLEANERAGWKYDIKAAESMQITKYKKGGHYNFHSDGRGDHLSTYNEPDNKFKHGNVRKLSMTILLNDNYEGGEFQFATYRKEKCTISTPEFNKVGSIIIFPSGMEHRVAPVTKGVRYSLVVWFIGPPFV
jgi:PKHD-type hydroxylase